MIPERIFSILRCPETKQNVTVADPTLIAALNERIAAGQLKNRGGMQLSVRLDGGLIREDGKIIYPVRNGIPVMLVKEGIPTHPGAEA